MTGTEIVGLIPKRVLIEAGEYFLRKQQRSTGIPEEDIIKIAMNHVYERMKKEGLRSRLVLQVHDELLIETKKEEIEEVSRILEEEMKGAADLAVELDVDMHQGDSWYEAK